MKASAIRHLAVTDERSIVAAALFERTVQIWSWKTLQQLGEFRTILNFGGRRLALTRDGKICIAGGWGRGLAAYSVPDGQVLWHRKDVHRLQRVTISASGREVYAGVEISTVIVLEVETGEVIAKVPRTTTIIPSLFDSRELFVKKGKYVVRGVKELGIPAASFALHTAAFSPNSVCLSEPNAGNRCIDLATGDLLWHHPTIHFGNATFNTSEQQFYCVTGFDTDPYENFLARLSRNFGDCKRLVAFGRSCWTEAFSPSGQVLVTSSGDVYETASGSRLGQLKFPQKDYASNG